MRCYPNLSQQKMVKVSQPLTIDIINIIGLPNQETTPEKKLCLIRNLQPEADFFPSKQYKDSSEEI